MTMVLGALVAYLVPAYAQTAQEWQSTSTMKGAGSSLASQVTAVGAAGVGEMATTTNSSKGPHKQKRDFDGGDGTGTGTNPGETGHQDEGSPIGDAVLPLMLCALAYLGMRVYLKRKRA